MLPGGGGRWLYTCGCAKELIFPQQGGVIQRKQMRNQTGLTKALYDCKKDDLLGVMPKMCPGPSPS